MKFDIENYRGNYAMHCKTEKEARDFCSYLKDTGRRWITGEPYDDKTKWNIFEENTVYYFNEGVYGECNIAMESGYKIIKWEGFMDNKFTKSDLKTGDVTLRRDGTTEIYNGELNMFITKEGWNDVENIHNDLTSTLFKEADIMAVRRPHSKHECGFYAFDSNCGELVYERKEVEEMTLEEVCRFLGKEIKIIKG